MALNLAAGVEPVAGYTLVRQLGRGGFGEVWEALAPGDVRVALKFVRLDTAEAGPEQRALALIRDIRHPHLLDIQFAVQVDDCLVLAMPLCERTLSDRARQCREQGLPGIPREELLGYMEDLARAVDFLNEPRHEPDGGVRAGVQHRDIKPNNIFLVGGSVRLADFGLAKVLSASGASHTGAMSPNYVAPEVIEGRVSARSDQYSLAVTYVQLRAGRLPFSGDGIPRVLYAHLQEPPDLTGLPMEERSSVARALAKRPEDRWPSCRAFVHDLKQLGSDSGYRAPVAPASAPEASDVSATLTGFMRSAPHDSAPTTETRGPCPFPSTEVAPAAPGPAGPAPTAPAPAPSAPAPRRRPLRLVILAGLVAACAGAAALGLLPVTGQVPPRSGPAPTGPAVPLTPPPAPPRQAEALAGIVPPAPPPPSKAAPEPSSKPEPKTSTPAVASARPERAGPVETTTNSIGMTLVLLPAGELVAGADSATPRVRIARPFYLGVREVTQGEYEQVMNENPSKFSARGDDREAVAGQDTRNYPVENVSWNDAVAFCNALSEREGLAPYYDSERGARAGGPGYRLPTEAEWEYACRAGSAAMYAHGDDEAGLGPHAWFAGNSGGQTHAVGQKRPNAFGLYDMHGNVWEWCLDEYRPGGEGGSPSSSTDRIYRGGSFSDAPRAVGAASRAWGSRQVRDRGLGFRVARDVGRPGS